MTAFIRQLDHCQHLLADHLAATIQVFGSAALGLIDLPSLSTAGRIVAEQLRAAGTLYWCMNIEDAGLPDFTDKLADAIWDGRINLAISNGGTRIAEYRRERDERRFNQDERRAIYEHLFGDSAGFSTEWRAFIESLYDLATLPGDVTSGSTMARAAVAARSLAQQLSDGATGIAAFAAREIVAHIRAALALLRDPELVRALGGGGVWQIIASHAPELFGHTVDSSRAIDRARSGLAIIEWLAARTASVESGTLVIGRDEVVVHAALTWRATGAMS